ncbi:uncharacterized protein ACNLHF_022622 [Anomaloglossus baeobatrachus]
MVVHCGKNVSRDVRELSHRSGRCCRNFGSSVLAPNQREYRVHPAYGTCWNAADAIGDIFSGPEDLAGLRLGKTFPCCLHIDRFSSSATKTILKDTYLAKYFQYGYGFKEGQWQWRMSLRTYQIRSRSWKVNTRSSILRCKT